MTHPLVQIHVNIFTFYLSAPGGNQESFLKTLAEHLREKYKKQTFEQIIMSVKRYLTRPIEVSL